MNVAAIEKRYYAIYTIQQSAVPAFGDDDAQHCRDPLWEENVCLLSVYQDLDPYPVTRIHDNTPTYDHYS